MKDTRLIMGMPISLEVLDAGVTAQDMENVFDYFMSIDERFSTYKETSEMMRINRGLIRPEAWSSDMKTVLALCEETKCATNGYFDIQCADGTLDPSGLVKGWCIQQAAQRLMQAGFRHYSVDAGGDIQFAGMNSAGGPWRVGIRNPFDQTQIVKTLCLEKGEGVATSGTSMRGQHIYNPFRRMEPLTEIVSLTVIGPNVYEADRFATAAFAMGRPGIQFIESLPGFEGYQIDCQGTATMTSRFQDYVC